MTRSARLRVLRELYRNFFRENKPEARGARLLRDWLSPIQRAQFDESSYFDVVGCHTGARYRIHYGRANNVQQIDAEGQPQLGYCFVPDGAYVEGDVMLSQKIALETNEQAVLAIANRFTPRGRPVPHRIVRRAY